MFGPHSTDPTYRRSQQMAGLPVRPSVIARGLALRIAAMGADPIERRDLGRLLLDELNHLGGLPAVELVVADRPQVHEHDGQRLRSKTYGYYRCWFEDGKVARSRIRIYHRTAVRQQVISPKVFLNTLLHEWTHHFDFAGLRLPRSPHTTGFYTRLRALAEALEVGAILAPTRDANGRPISGRRAARNVLSG